MQGWAEIIREMKEKLQCFDIHIIEIKEKWGVLRVIYNFEGAEADKNEIQKIIAEAEDKSSVTCEICGNPGELINNHGWLKTLCDNCRLKTDNEDTDPYPLSAKPDDLRRWIEEGKKKGAIYLIEMTDSFDWHDYPVYVMPGEDPEKIKAEATRDMIYVSRVFDLQEGSEVLSQKEGSIHPSEKTSLHLTNKIDLWTERIKGIISLIAFSAIGILLVLQILKGPPVGAMLLSVIGSLFCFALGIISFFTVFPPRKVAKNDKNEKSGQR